MVLPPAWSVAGLYILVAASIIFTQRRDMPALRVARYWLAVGMLCWAGFYFWIEVTGLISPITTRTVLSRWFHFTSGSGIGVLIWSRWVLTRKQER